ncbi:MAG TPA: redoxin family protein [Actinoplanes sp.]|nr:redoxin family protein [Actinoplanes sp.]
MKWLVAVLAGLLLAVTGCTTPAATPAAATTALSFTGTTIDGTPFDAAAMAGKPALLWFWAPWCATCAAQAGSVTNVAQEYGDRLAVLGVAGMGSTAEMREFVTDLEVGGIRNLDDQAGVLWKRFGVTEQSTYVLVDRAGTVVSTGYLDDRQLTTKVKSLVG